jgi:hypothetical protein
MICGSHERQNIYTRIYIRHWTHFVEFIIYITTVQIDYIFYKLFQSYDFAKLVR